MRGVLIAVALAFLGLFLVAPLITVFGAAFSKGIDPYLAALAEPETWAAIQLTLITAGIAVPMNTIFGIAAAWVLSKYDFRGKSALLTLIDLPFSVSPVISGLIFVLLFGAQGLFTAQVQAYDVKVVFAVPGIVLATTFVTFPLVAREVLAVMERQGSDEEEAALTLGASLWQIFPQVTLPKIRWGLFYGVILCNARAMGEFRGRFRGVRSHPRRDEHDAACRSKSLQRIQLRGGVRRGVALDAAGAAHARSKRRTRSSRRRCAMRGERASRVGADRDRD